MVRLFILLSVVASLLSVACEDVQAQSTRGSYVAHLNGRNQIPPIITRAQGQAIFQLSQDGQSMRYVLIVAHIRDVIMAHIHQGPADGSGPPVVWLYPDAPPPVLIPGFSNGILAVGEITADNLVGPLAGKSLNDLLVTMRAGGTYVNVHTAAYPGGEIRGQIFLNRGR
jgi:hypothetical protein